MYFKLKYFKLKYFNLVGFPTRPHHEAMKRNKNNIPNGCEELIYQNSERFANAMSAETIPTLVPERIMAELTKNDTEPFFKVEAIELPAKGTGGTYEKSFFESYNSIMKERPIPGSKRGHEWISRPNTDFYTVGGMIQKSADGVDVEYLKIYIPKTGDTTDNAGFLRDARAGIVHFSLVTAPEYMVKKDEDGNDVRHFISSKGYERNDAVEYGAGAMRQVVNSRNDFSLIEENVNRAKQLIASGKFDRESKWIDPYKNKSNSGDAAWFLAENTDTDDFAFPFGKDGKVFRSALRAIAARAENDGYLELTEAANELVSLIDKNKNRGGNRMDDVNDAYGLVSNMLANGKISIQELAKKCGFENKLRTENDEQNAETIKKLNGLLDTENVFDTVSNMKKELVKNEQLAVENAVIKKVGSAKIKNAQGVEEDNPAYVRGMELCNGKTGEELEKALNGFKDDALMKLALGNMADSNSSINTVETSGSLKNGAGEVATY